MSSPSIPNRYAFVTAAILNRGNPNDDIRRASFVPVGVNQSVKAARKGIDRPNAPASPRPGEVLAVEHDPFNPREF